MTLSSPGHAALMDGVYRHQRHIYDLTRRYFLLGRDELIDGLAVPEDGRVLEVGCGTGRNLVAIARRHRAARCVGVDISSEMLAVARRKVATRGLAGRVALHLGDAASLDGLGLGRFDRVVFSYTLSMIPRWREALDQGVRMLAPGGSLHVVDFGPLDGAPHRLRDAFHAWLGRFHVTPRADLPAALAEIAARHGASASSGTSHAGYARVGMVRASEWRAEVEIALAG
jgi:S-adenosylmethionine-diacylgycerolhomoserine-N-methlytransferase